MNRLKATNSVAFANRDTAPGSGTPQYATDGNPSTSTPATVWPAYAWNMIQDEIMNVITTAGITPDDTNWGQLATAIATLASVSGVSQFNGRTGNVTLGSSDVTGALGYTPYNSSNPSGYISGITSGMVTGALGYTPVNKAGDSLGGTLDFNANSAYFGATSNDPIGDGVQGTAINSAYFNSFHPSAAPMKLSNGQSGGGDIINFFAGKTGVGSISTNGSNTSYNTSSARALKDNIRDYASGLDIVREVAASRYNMKGDDKDVSEFIAEDVYPHVPEATTGVPGAQDGEGKPIHMSMDYSRMLPPLWSAVRQLDALIQQQASEIAMLREEIRNQSPR